VIWNGLQAGEQAMEIDRKFVPFSMPIGVSKENLHKKKLIFQSREIS